MEVVSVFSKLVKKIRVAYFPLRVGKKNWVSEDIMYLSK